MDVVAQYFSAFNASDVDGMLACLSDDVAHHVNEGQVRIGKPDFAAFCAHMNRCYRETLTEMTILTTPTGTRVAAEFVVHGIYLTTDAGLPDAHGQTYKLAAGSFFDIKDDKIARVTTYYNLADWLRQVSA